MSEEVKFTAETVPPVTSVTVAVNTVVPLTPVVVVEGDMLRVHDMGTGVGVRVGEGAIVGVWLGDGVGVRVGVGNEVTLMVAVSAPRDTPSIRHCADMVALPVLPAVAVVVKGDPASLVGDTVAAVALLLEKFTPVSVPPVTSVTEAVSNTVPPGLSEEDVGLKLTLHDAGIGVGVLEGSGVGVSVGVSVGVGVGAPPTEIDAVSDPLDTPPMMHWAVMVAVPVDLPVTTTVYGEVVSDAVDRLATVESLVRKFTWDTVPPVTPDTAAVKVTVSFVFSEDEVGVRLTVQDAAMGVGVLVGVLGIGVGVFVGVAGGVGVLVGEGAVVTEIAAVSDPLDTPPMMHWAVMVADPLALAVAVEVYGDVVSELGDTEATVPLELEKVTSDTVPPVTPDTAAVRTTVSPGFTDDEAGVRFTVQSGTGVGVGVIVGAIQLGVM